jgi:lipopolysaccharide assembly outer membrane protein LptD (OstA)
MRNPRALLALLLLSSGLGLRPVAAQEAAHNSTDAVLEVEGEGLERDEATGISTGTNGVVVKYTDASGLTLLTARRAQVNEKTQDIQAEGSVRIQKDNETWIGDWIHYNYLTKEMSSDWFRMGKPPLFIQGEHLHGTGGGTNGFYEATNATITTDEYDKPLQKVRAKRFVILPGKYVEARNATVYVGNVPVFYLPYYRRSLVENPNTFTFLPGYRSLYGPYLLSTYNWFINEQIEASFHGDYRVSRGLGAGPELKYNFGHFGEGSLSYYYAHDLKPGTDPNLGTPLPHDRDRVYFSDNANPLTNLTVQSQVDYQRDPYITRDFFESQYQKDIQPATFVDANQAWQNWSLDALTQTRVNPFWETVERLPDVRLNGYRQQIGDLPVYYESQSSIGYFRRLFSDTNMPPTGDFSATRADTFHQLTLPETFFGWLTVTPRVGGRYTYYDAASGPGATTTNHYRGVFNTGAEASLTASRLWSGVRNDFLDLDGLRHIFQPSINYVYVPQPSVLPSQLPQFDYELTNSLRLLPIDFPDYNSIDSINSENTIRYGLNNRLQTKRNGEIEDLVDWSLYMDWNLHPRSDQSTFSDIYSELTLKPRSWVSFSSGTRYSIKTGEFNLAQHNLTLQPNNTWSWSIGHLFLRSGPIFGTGDNVVTSTFFYRLNENWGTRLAHYFDASTGTLEEQDYTVYRDLRSWTAALTFRALNNLANGKDYTVAFTFSFKSFPRYQVGADSARAAQLVGY